MNLDNSTIKLTFINHAGYSLEYKNICLLVDPWISGTAFFNGWNFISKTYFPNELAKKVNYIWISHEHPDHFSTKDLKKLKEINNNITIIFQHTKDKRVITFLKKIGFKIIELANSQEKFLRDDFKIQVIKCGSLDSCSVMTVRDQLILNTNDCLLDSDRIKNISIMKCDLLLTQFSYAVWAGKPEDNSKRKKAAFEKLEQISNQIDHFKPKKVMPFASYIYFCHEENKYMNDSIVSLDAVKKLIIKKNVEPLILYPGSAYIFNTNHNSDIDLKKYIEDFSNIRNQEFLKSEKSYNINELMFSSELYINRIYKKNLKIIVYSYYFVSRILNYIFKKDIFGLSSIKIYIHDLNIKTSFDWYYGLKVIQCNETELDIKIHSEMLNHIFLYEYGSSTLSVNARASYFKEDSLYKFYRIFSLGAINSVGKNLLSMTFSQILEKGFFKLFKNSEIEPSYLEKDT
jgi:hypothetical protein